jgi:hypothetical protein
MMKKLSWIFAVVLTLLLPACVSVKSTTAFYTPTTANFYPPKDKHVVIPIMGEPPSQPYREIGRFAFQSDMGYPFMMKAIEYNARLAGADAVYIKESKSWTVPVWYSVPPTVSWVPVGGWYGGGCGGWYGGAAMVPITYPGYSGVSYQSYMGIDARMLVFKR